MNDIAHELAVITRWPIGYETSGGYESLRKVSIDTYVFTGEDGVQTAMNPTAAAECKAEYFPSYDDEFDPQALKQAGWTPMSHPWREGDLF